MKAIVFEIVNTTQIQFDLTRFRKDFCMTLVRANLYKVTFKQGRLQTRSPSNSTTGGSPLIFSVPFSYFLFIFYFPRCTLPDFPSVSSLASLPFLPCHRTTTQTIAQLTHIHHRPMPSDCTRGS